MIKFKIDIEGLGDVFAPLRQAIGDLTPVMRDIGEHLVETTKRRFDTSTGPDGARWAPNTETTYLRMLGKYKGVTGKNGRINARGAGRVMAKKPLIGETHALSTTINYQTGGQFVEIGSPMEYASTQQLGAKKHSFTGGKTPWGDIPARPFLGVSDDDRSTILDIVGTRLRAAVSG